MIVAGAGLLILLLADVIYFRLISTSYIAALPESYDLQVFIQNLLPVLGLSFFLWLASARIMASFVLTAVFVDAVFFANQLKLINLRQPLMAIDFILAPDMVGHSGLLSKYFLSYWHPGLLGILLVAGLLLLWFERPVFSLKPLWRISAVAILFFVFISPTAVGTLRDFYRPGDDWKAWDPGENLENYGLLFSLMHDAGTMISDISKFDSERIEHILSQDTSRRFVPDDSLPPVENIVVILSESFFDPADLVGVRTGQYDLAAYTDLQSRSLTGKMTVPTYAGRTLRTEFELMTGIDLNLAPMHEYPLITLVTRPFHSFVWDLLNGGYSTTAIHANIGSFWNRDKAYPFLGFEKFLEIQSFEDLEYSGYYVADSALTRKVKAEIRDGEKQFIFAISMENHGPWKTGRPYLDAAKVSSFKVPEQLVGENAVAMQQFLYHQQLAQAGLLEIIQDLESRETRSLVLFFGDHLPGLQRVFNEIGFKNGLSSAEQYLPYLFYDTHNKNLKHKEINGVIDVSYLGSVLLGLVLDDLPEFHQQANRLHLGDRGDRGLATTAQTDLGQLQLWRLWGTPVDGNGEEYSATAMMMPGKNTSVELDQLNCPVSGWGPKKAYVGETFNEQPSGHSAFYVKTECPIDGLTIRIDKKELWTSQSPTVVTALLDATELTKESGAHAVELFESSTGRSQRLGVFKVKRRLWPQ